MLNKLPIGQTAIVPSNYQVLSQRMNHGARWATRCGVVTLVAWVLLEPFPFHWVLTAIVALFALRCWLAMFRIVATMHGRTVGCCHLALSITLTPVFLTGLILIPVLVDGDAKRLLAIDDALE